MLQDYDMALGPWLGKYMSNSDFYSFTVEYQLK